MKYSLLRPLPLLVLLSATAPAFADNPRVVKGLKRPESVVVSASGRIYVALPGEIGRDGDGTIVTVEPDGKLKPFAVGLDDPRGMVFVGNRIIVVDRTKVWRVDAAGRLEVYAPLKAFPRRVLYLADVAGDGNGGVYVTDSGDRAGNKGAVYQINPSGKVRLMLDAELTKPVVDVPGSVLGEDDDHFLVTDLSGGYLYLYDLETNTAQRVEGGLGAPVGLVKSDDGRLFVGDGQSGKLFEVDSIREVPTLLTEKFAAIADLCLSPDRKSLLVLDRKAGTLTWFPIP